MDDHQRTHLSKFLSLVLRHQPEILGLVLDPHGWVEIDVLLAKFHAHGKTISRETLDEIVATSPKQRFAISEDGLRIRASQGHSVEVELGYQPAVPPSVLFHGTVASQLASIRAQGLQKMQRHHVHLSADEATARTVGMRRGNPVVLRIAAAAMHAAGHTFFLSANGVWLTEQVPPQHIAFP